MQYLELPREIVSGDFIAFVHEQMALPDGLKMRYSFSGSTYFERMKERELYSTNRTDIQKRVGKADMADVYSNCLV